MLFCTIISFRYSRTNSGMTGSVPIPRALYFDSYGRSKKNEWCTVGIIPTLHKYNRSKYFALETGTPSE